MEEGDARRKKKLHPDFGPPSYGIPFNVVGGGAPTTLIDFTYAIGERPGPYPFSGATPIEGGSDRHALMVDSDTCTLYELFNARWNGGNPTAGSGAIFDLNSERPASRRLDQRRRRGVADPARARPLRRGRWPATSGTRSG